MSVSVSGALLSSLFYEQSNCPGGDNEGFLLGKVVSHVTDEISDSQMTNVKETTVIYIQSYIPFLGLYNWYDSSGAIDHGSMKDCFSNNKSHRREVVGWYKFRRNSSFRISLREASVHKHLLECFPNISPNMFLFCLCTATTTQNNGIHSFDHSFNAFNGRSFEALPLTVENLGDTAQSNYKYTPAQSANTSGLYPDIINSFRPQVANAEGKLQSVMSFKTLNCTLNKQLMDLCYQVAETEQMRAQLEKETDDMEKQIATIQDSRKPPSPMPVTHDASLPRLNPIHRHPQGPIPVPIQTNSPSLPRKSAGGKPTKPEPAQPDLIVLDDFDPSESLTDVPTWKPLIISRDSDQLNHGSRSPSPQIIKGQTRTKPGTDVEMKSTGDAAGPKSSAAGKSGASRSRDSQLDSLDNLWQSARAQQVKVQGDKSRSNSVDSDVIMDTSNASAKPGTPRKTRANVQNESTEEDMDYDLGQSDSPTF